MLKDPKPPMNPKETTLTTHPDASTKIYGINYEIVSIFQIHYIYIYCHPQKDCFVVSQLFRVARNVGRLKLGSKPVQLYVRLTIRPLGQQAYHVGKRTMRYYVATAAAAFVCLHFISYQIPECSIRSKRFVLCERQPIIPSPECSAPMGEHVVCIL